MTKAYDVHMHLLPVTHVCLSAYLDFALQNSAAEAYAQATAANYVVPGVIKREGNMLNIVSVMERSIPEQLALYEADLRARFAPEGEKAVLDDSGVTISGGAEKRLHYDRLTVCPQVMDFNIKKPLSGYYRDAVDHDILRQAQEMLDGIKEFYALHPESLLEVQPFLGINPLCYDISYIQRVLETCFPVSKTAASGSNAVSEPHFVGVKVYPPLGFDPYPDDEAGAVKMDLLFSFCEARAIPIVTHCDDQGFRMLPLEDSFRFTSPERWEPVLSRHPNLWLDFAHFGEQYYRGFPLAELKDWPQKLVAALKKSELTWRSRILCLMKRYPHVYADVSFGGATSDNWTRLTALLAGVAEADRELYESRILFGTDWPLSLTKTESALSYWRGFSESNIPEKTADKFLWQNPEAFLFH